jgi:flagellar protein FliO/FliZ
MTWMVIRLILSLAFVGAVLWFAARLAKKRGLGSSNGVIEVVARQRMGRASTVNVVRVGDVVLVVGATEQQVTLLAEVDAEPVALAMAERRGPGRRPLPAPREDRPAEGYPAEGFPAEGFPAEGYPDDEYARAYGETYGEGYPEGYAGDHRRGPAPAHRGAHASQGALAGSVFDRRGWGTFVQELRERTVRRP